MTKWQCDYVTKWQSAENDKVTTVIIVISDDNDNSEKWQLWQNDTVAIMTRQYYYSDKMTFKKWKNEKNDSKGQMTVITNWCTDKMSKSFIDIMTIIRKWHLWGNATYEKMTIMRKWQLWQNDYYKKMTIMNRWQLWQNDNYDKMTIMTKWQLWQNDRKSKCYMTKLL